MAPGAARLRPRRLRLHDLHRQLRARSTSRSPQAIEEQRSRRRRRPVGQPQLRGPHPSPGARELSRLAAARRGLRPGRAGRHRPDDASRSGTIATGARCSSRTSGRSPTRSGAVIGEVDRSGAVPANVRHRVRGRRPLAGAADPGRRPLRLGRELDVRRAAAVLRGPDRPSPRPSPTSSARGSLAVLGDSVTTDHISPAGSIAAIGHRPASGSRSTAWRPRSSTRTAPGAAITR